MSEKVAERIVSFDPDGARYCSLKLDRRGDNLTISGHCGEIMTDEQLQERVDDYFDDIDIEDEFGYLADEIGITGERKRKEYFETIESDLRQYNYPYETYKSTWNDKLKDDVVFTIDSAGQITDDVCKEGVKTVGSPFYLAKLCKIWDEHHLEDTSESVHKQAKKLLKSFPGFEDFSDDWINDVVKTTPLSNMHLNMKDITG